VEFMATTKSQSQIYEWVERFKEGGRPSNVTCVEVKEKIDQRVRDNRRVSH